MDWSRSPIHPRYQAIRPSGRTNGTGVRDMRNVVFLVVGCAIGLFVGVLVGIVGVVGGTSRGFESL